MRTRNALLYPYSPRVFPNETREETTLQFYILFNFILFCCLRSVSYIYRYNLHREFATRVEEGDNSPRAVVSAVSTTDLPAVVSATGTSLVVVH